MLVIFKPSESYYNFGRLADPENIARYGPLSQSPKCETRKNGDEIDAYSPEDGGGAGLQRSLVNRVCRSRLAPLENRLAMLL